MAREDDVKAIMTALGDELRQSLEHLVGEDVKPQTPQEMAEILQSCLTKRIDNPDMNIKVTPTNDDGVLNLSFSFTKPSYIKQRIYLKEDFDEEL